MRHRRGGWRWRLPDDFPERWPSSHDPKWPCAMVTIKGTRCGRGWLHNGPHGAQKPQSTQT